MKTVITTHISHLLQHKQNERKGHSSDYEGDKTSGIYCRVVFVRCILPPTSRQVSTSIQLHGTISKKAVIFIQKAISHKTLSTMSIPPMCSGVFTLSIPLSDLPFLLDKKTMNGLDMERILQFDHSSAAIVKNIHSL
jgi:hypothetical protein